MPEIPIESPHKYSGKVDWEGGADEFMDAALGRPAADRRNRVAAMADGGEGQEVDASIFSLARDSARKYGG